MLSKDGFKTVSCACGGSGFSGHGTGYDAVCDNCGGQGEVLDFSDEIEEAGMTIALLESDLLDYKTRVEQLQKEVERMKSAIIRIDSVNGSIHAFELIERIIAEVSHDPL